jgi:hypothetical protein
LFDGVKHSDLPDLEAIMNGRADISDLVVEGAEVPAKSVHSMDGKTAIKVDETCVKE